MLYSLSFPKNSPIMVLSSEGVDFKNLTIPFLWAVYSSSYFFFYSSSGVSSYLGIFGQSPCYISKLIPFLGLKLNFIAAFANSVFYVLCFESRSWSDSYTSRLELERISSISISSTLQMGMEIFFRAYSASIVLLKLRST